MVAFLIYILAGLGAGVLTALAGLSAATIISPILITFLGFDAYVAIGVSLSSDVLASALSSVIYAKQGKIDMKGSLWLLLPAIVLTLVGCFAGYAVSNIFLSVVSCLFPICMGLRFIISREDRPLTFVRDVKTRTRHILAIGSGVVIGLICGFSGAGGGMMMLMLLTMVLSYELKTAVGTSVFIMTFLALVGAIAHFTIVGTVNWGAMITCSASALVGTFFTALFVNRVNTQFLHRVIGISLFLLGIFLIVFKFVLP